MQPLTSKLRALAPRAARLAALAALMTAVVVGSAGPTGAKSSRSSAGNLVFVSTQFTPVTEQQSFINTDLKGFTNATVSYIPGAVPDLVNRVNAETQAGGTGTVSLAAANAGDLESVSS